MNRIIGINHVRPRQQQIGRERLTLEHKENIVPRMFLPKEVAMLKVFVEEAAALASITLFVGMIALWAQILPQL